MSRKAKAVVVEDEFDDDTDLPLPNAPLPNTGARGPLLQQVDDGAAGGEYDYDYGDNYALDASQHAGPASPPSSQSQFQSQNTITDITPYKSWTCIYPIYIDAKRPYGTGQRRLPRQKSVWWPLSKDIAEACGRLGLGTLHEVQKAHPRDWENPGRVRVQWRKEGRLVNEKIRSKKQLLEMISLQIQHFKPENIPRPPFSSSLNTVADPTSTSASIDATSSSSTGKGKAPATPSGSGSGKDKGKSTVAAAAVQPKAHTKGTGAGSGKNGKGDKKQPKPSNRRVPVPPAPHPPLAERVSPYSPALSTGMLIETVKAGMNATGGEGSDSAPGTPSGAPGAGTPFGAPAGPQKGKRKVVRVRG